MSFISSLILSLLCAVTITHALQNTASYTTTKTTFNRPSFQKEIIFDMPVGDRNLKKITIEVHPESCDVFTTFECHLEHVIEEKNLDDFIQKIYLIYQKSRVKQSTDFVITSSLTDALYSGKEKWPGSYSIGLQQNTRQHSTIEQQIKNYLETIKQSFNLNDDIIKELSSHVDPIVKEYISLRQAH